MTDGRAEHSAPVRRLCYLQFANPGAYPPLLHSARLLADAGWDVFTLGVAANTDPLTFFTHPRLTARMLPAPPAGWRQKAAYATFATSAVVEVLSRRPDWVYVSDPLAAPVGLTLQGLGFRVLYHEHDSPNPDESPGTVMHAVFAARRRLAASAPICVLPNAARAELVVRDAGCAAPLVVWNCPLRSEVASPRPSAAGALRVLYHGTLVPARLPLSVIDALALLPPTVTLSIAGYETIGHPGYLAALMARARSCGVEDRVTFAGALSRTDVMANAARCDVGLALLPEDPTDLNERHMVGASNKPFDYMACGLALLVGPGAEWRRVFVDAGFARRCDPASARDVADALRWFASHPADTMAMERGRLQILDSWNYNTTFHPVLRQIASVST